MKQSMKLRAAFVSAGGLTAAAALALSLSVLQPSRAQDQLPQQSYLPLSQALDAANAALDSCDTDGYNVSVAIVDQAGNTKVLLRGDESSPATIVASQRKAFTSASFGQPTQNLVNSIAMDPALEGLRDLDDRILILGGGLPIRFGGELVGGIGVAGAPGGDLDEACAEDGLSAINADTGTGTGTPEATGTIEETGTPEATETVEETGTPDATGTVEGTETPEVTGTVEETGTPDATGTVEGTETPEVTGTVEETGTPDVTGTVEGTGTPEVTGTVTGTGTPSVTGTVTVTATP